MTPAVSLRLIPVAAAAWLSAAASTMLPAIAWMLALIFWAAALGVTIVIAVRPRRRRALVITLFALVVAAAAASHLVAAQPARSQIPASVIEGGRAVTIDAVVTGKVERRATGELAFDAVATRIATGASVQNVRVEVSVQVQPSDVDGAALDVGSTVIARGTATSTDAGERAVLWVRASRGVEVRHAAGGVLAATSALRHGLISAVDDLPQPGAGLVPGLAVGDTSVVDLDLDAAMKQSSLSHLTAVSGANCALVVGLAFAAAAMCGARRAVRVTVGVLALVGFVLLVTPEPSVVRAGAMALIAMLAVLLARPAAGMAILSLAVAVLLITDPWLSTSLGFALSTAATGSLLLFARSFADGLGRWMPRALALGLSVPLAAQLACGPLLVLIAPTVPVYGVVANMLAAPAAPVATIVGLAACLSAPIPLLQSGLSAIAWLPAAWIATTATTFATLPGSQLPWWEGFGGLLALAAVGVAVGILIAVGRRAGPGVRLTRATAAAGLAVALGVGLGTAALTAVVGRWTLPAQWSVIACDVGQGDAILLRSRGAIALIDTGPDPAPLRACLTRVGVERIDLLVLTHFDLDHVGGVETVAGRVGTVLHGPTTSDADAALVAGLETGGATAVDARAGLAGTLGDAEWRVLWPPADSAAFASGNDASVVLDVRGTVDVPTMLLLGDLSASPQRALAASPQFAPPYDLVKVAHHGSADQEPLLYERATPSLALFTVGPDNDYDHPRDETLALFEGRGITVARTDEQGLVALWRDEHGLSIWRERRDDVDPAG